MSVWIYKLNNDYSYKSSLFNGVTFSNEWGNIRDGVLTIYRGYAWDGCSPKVKIGKYVIGVWDGWNSRLDGLPITYYASLVHDFLCQFKTQIPMKKKDVVLLFNLMLEERKWPFAEIYTRAVDMFGPQKFGGDK